MKKNGKFAKRGIATKAMVMILAVMLIVGISVGGTLAWLTASAGDVVNTFTVGDININIWEHDYDPTTGALKSGDTNLVKTNDDYKFVPGATLPKDPYVVVEANSEACWLFVTVDAANNTNGNVNIVNYTVDTSVWNPVSGETNVWYTQVSAADAVAGKTFNVLANQQVTVSGDVTKAMVSAINTNKPTLTFKAYAIQSANLSDANGAAVTEAAAAWALVKPAA